MLKFKDLKKLVRQVLKENKRLLSEGGAGGHMRHPFDLDDVKTGPDLFKKFIQIGQEIKNGNLPDTKIDGVNTSIKLVDGPNGKEFAMDRGSMKPEDLEGMTIDRLTSRFGEGHGMVAAGKNVLGIFNDALPDIEPELRELGMLNDSSKFFNMEYVKGTTNVLAYDHDFLKIHGVNQFYNRKDRAGNMVRPGQERPLDPETNKPIKDPSSPVSYNEEALESLVSKLNKYSENYGFKVYSEIPSKAAGTFDFESVLSAKVPVTYAQGNVKEGTLGERLKTAKNRVGELVRTKDGRKIPAQGKEIYKAVLGASAADRNADPSRQIPLNDLLVSNEDYEKAIDGAVFWHATRLLGDVIIDNMEVDHPAVKGPAKDHEGLVVRLSGDNFDTKITGDFILGGEASTFRKGDTKGSKTIAMFPGSFKPPHKGHLSVIKNVINTNPDVDEVRVIVSAPGKDVRSPKITPEKAKMVFDKYIESAALPRPVTVEVSSLPSPIGAAFSYIEKTEGNQKIFLLTSEADASRYPQESLDKSASKNPNSDTITVKSLVLPACKNEGCETAEKISATTIRNIVDKYPNVTLQDIKEATNLMPETLSQEQKLEIFDLLVDDKVSNKFSKEELDSIGQLEEASGVGGIAGYAGSVSKQKRNKEERTIYNMNKKLSLEESILKDYLVERYTSKFKKILKEASEPSTGMSYVTDAFKGTRKMFEERYTGLGQQDQRTSFFVNFINKMVHAFIQQDISEQIKPVMPFSELEQKGILTPEVSQSGQQFAKTALEENELKEQDIKIGVDTKGKKGKEEAPPVETDPEGIIPPEDPDAVDAEKEADKTEKVKAGQASPDVTMEPIPNTNETGNRAAADYYKVNSKNILAKYSLIGPDDIEDREKFIEYYFKNVIALAAGLEQNISGKLPEPLFSMNQRLTSGTDIVNPPKIEEPEETPAPAPEEAPVPTTTPAEAPLAESQISNLIRNSVINTFKRLQIR
jgi:hypothetical protein